MKFRSLIFVSIISIFLTNAAHAGFLQMTRQYDYVGVKPPAVQSVNSMTPVTTSSQTPATKSGLQTVAQFQSKPQIVPQNQYADGMNLYQYCQSDPVNKIDPWGLECGVVVKRFVVRDSSWIDMGHEWLSTGSGSIGFWPNGAGIPGREWSVFSPDPGESSSKAPDIVWDTNRDNGWFNEKKLKWGTGAGKKCCAATCSDITSCVLSSPDPGWRNNAIFNNCRKFVDVTLKGCCLSKGKRT